MKIRLMGLPDELDQLLAALNQADVLDMAEISGPYPNRGDSRMARIYIEARPRPSCGEPHTANGHVGQLPPGHKRLR